MTLRYKLGLNGTKLGCDRAECGACMQADHVARGHLAAPHLDDEVGATGEEAAIGTEPGPEVDGLGERGRLMGPRSSRMPPHRAGLPVAVGRRSDPQSEVSGRHLIRP